MPLLAEIWRLPATDLQLGLAATYHPVLNLLVPRPTIHHTHVAPALVQCRSLVHPYRSIQRTDIPVTLAPTAPPPGDALLMLSCVP